MRTTGKKLAAALSVIATVGALGAVAAPATASAQTTKPTVRSAAAQAEAKARAEASCPAEQVCFYPDRDYRGTPVNVDPWNMPTCGDTPIPAASVYNHSRDVYTFFPKVGCEGKGGTLNPDTGVPNFDAIGAPRVASWR
ncbi:peptidase inhibitor family I36 protein [Streptomyces sp. HNM0574]|uniref:peptidase inhibitor family I36 protein n=1 Tax=Streptomyces sp. HNM0574 TaxID=2714954 RepID=UPI00146F2392|nr:peptidase inhibitor family I36 protein [Streptomyces sp. HNM0574]NLU70348.1 hypothetical protein [Streptomyces sp. HNM0574]